MEYIFVEEDIDRFFNDMVGKDAPEEGLSVYEFRDKTDGYIKVGLFLVFDDSLSCVLFENREEILDVIYGLSGASVALGKNTPRLN